MNKNKLLLWIFSCLCLLKLDAQSASDIKPFGPLPTKQQLDWHELEFYLFMHFGPNTFTNKEWGHGDEAAAVFNPGELDCKQWCRIAKDCGAKGIIITAKHHDGFCLWPSTYSKHTVRESAWKGGQGDVLRDLSAACKEAGLLFGVYISPWDRNHPDYGTPGYNDVYVNTMKEVVSNYGPIFEMWWDGANGEGPNGKKQIYDFPRFEKVIKEIAPDAVVFSDVGPGVRWVGNESGIAGTTNWNLLNIKGFTPGAGSPPQDTLNRGNENGSHWIPAECDVSIRPGWFYHAEEDDKVKTPEQLFQLYLKSVGRGGNFLLNVPPDRRGLIHPNDSAALMGFRAHLDSCFDVNLLKELKIHAFSNGSWQVNTDLTDGNRNTFLVCDQNAGAHVRVNFGKTSRLNCITLSEPLQMGQRVKGFKVMILKNKQIVKTIEGTTIGRKRILTFPTMEVDGFSIAITQSKATPLLSELGAYHITETLIER